MRGLITIVKAKEDYLLNLDEVSTKVIKLRDKSRRSDLWIEGIKEELN